MLDFINSSCRCPDLQALIEQMLNTKNIYLIYKDFVIFESPESEYSVKIYHSLSGYTFDLKEGDRNILTFVVYNLTEQDWTFQFNTANRFPWLTDDNTTLPVLLESLTLFLKKEGFEKPYISHLSGQKRWHMEWRPTIRERVDITVRRILHLVKTF